MSVFIGFYIVTELAGGEKNCYKKPKYFTFYSRLVEANFWGVRDEIFLLIQTKNRNFPSGAFHGASPLYLQLLHPLVIMSSFPI